jgi:hypothetical protein
MSGGRTFSPGLLRLGAIAGVAAALASLGGCATTATKAGHTETAVAAAPMPPVTVPIPPAALATPEERWGVQVAGIRLSAAGYMLDLRYRVLDAGKAAPVINRRVKPYLVAGESGAKLMVPNTPKLGLLRQVASGASPDRTHFMLFANPGQTVQAGNKVTLVMGDLKVEDIVVQ